MEFVKKGFGVNYELLVAESFKPGGNGVMDNGRSYPASLKFKSINVIESEDQELGLIDKEELIEFKIPCSSNSEAGELNKLFRLLKSNGIPIQINGSLPRKYDNSSFLNVDVYNTPQDLFLKYGKLLQKEPPKAS